MAVAVLLVGGGAVAALYFGTDLFSDGNGDAPPTAMTAAEAELAAQSAPARLQESVANPIALEVRQIRLAGAVDNEWIDGASLAATMDVGYDGDFRTTFTMSFAEGGFETTMSLGITCIDGHAYTSIADEVYDQRRGGDDFDCDTAALGEIMNGGHPDVAEWGINRVPGWNLVETNRTDGGAIARYDDGNGGDVTVLLDARGRPTQVDARTPEGDFQIELAYGDPVRLTVPRDVIVASADLFLTPTSEGGFGNETIQWYRVSGAHDNFTRNEFEIRVYPRWHDVDADPAGFLAAYSLDAAQHDSGGFEFRWQGDGGAVLDEDDRFSVHRPNSDIVLDYDVVLWDRVAAAPAGGVAMPGPWSGLAVFAAILVARRGLAG